MKISKIDYRMIKHYISYDISVPTISAMTGASKTTIYRVRSSRNFKDYKRIAIANAKSITVTKRRKWLRVF